MFEGNPHSTPAIHQILCMVLWVSTFLRKKKDTIFFYRHKLSVFVTTAIKGKFEPKSTFRFKFLDSIAYPVYISIRIFNHHKKLRMKLFKCFVLEYSAFWEVSYEALYDGYLYNKYHGQAFRMGSRGIVDFVSCLYIMRA